MKTNGPMSADGTDPARAYVRHRRVRPLVLAFVSALAMVLAGLAAPLAAAATLQISQVVDNAPDLEVFVTGNGLPTIGKGTSSVVTSAGLGTARLPLKASVPWDPAAAISVVVALDVSASLNRRDFDVIKRTLAASLMRLPADSRVALLSIGNDVRTVHAFDTPAVIAGGPLDSLAPDSSETALYEALLSAQDVAATAGRALPLRRIVLVLTDGMDDSSRGFSPEEALRKISTGDAPIFALALVPARANPKQLQAVRSLAQIARASGGAFVEATATTIGTALQALLANARNVQRLTFDCAHCTRDGLARPLQVTVRDGGVDQTDTRDVRLPFDGKDADAPKAGSPKPVVTPAPVILPPTAPTSATSAFVDRLLAPPWLYVLIALVVLAVVAVLFRLLRTKEEAGEATGRVREPTTLDHTLDGNDEPPVSDDPPRLDRVAHGGRLITVDIAGQGRLEVRIGAGESIVGRSKTCDVPIDDDPEASNRHAALSLVQGVLMLRDLGSANGTYLNGTRIVRPEPLHDRDMLTIGRTEVRLYFEAA